ncbi:MAG: tRNA pseudouridine(55) synthase TruB, partial [Polyangiaceae bacterium]
MNGVFVVDKPSGSTSHDVVRVLRKKLGTRAVGHAGTLDPMATGVLVIAVGEATKLVPYLTAAEKEYETTILLGITSETLDADAKYFSHAPVPDDWQTNLEAALEIERRRKSQIPPNYSAIHVNG